MKFSVFFPRLAETLKVELYTAIVTSPSFDLFVNFTDCGNECMNKLFDPTTYGLFVIQINFTIFSKKSII